MMNLQDWQAWIDDIKRTGISDDDLKVLAEALDFAEQPLPERAPARFSDQAQQPESNQHE